MQSIAETCVRFDAAHLSINLVSEIAVPMFTTLSLQGKKSRKFCIDLRNESSLELTKTEVATMPISYKT